MANAHDKFPVWTAVVPLAAWAAYFIGTGSMPMQLAGGILLIGSVLAAVHHAEVVAHKVGEPFGTIILALAVTVIEVALIVSLMVAGGSEAAYLARDTVFAAIMLILNGILGISLLFGAWRHYEQFLAAKSVSTALVTLVAILVLTLILPNFTASTEGPTYNAAQMVFVAAASLVLYGTFVMVQTVRHRDYFLADADGEDAHAMPPSGKTAAVSLLLLFVCLGVVVLLAKALSPAVEGLVNAMGAPLALVGVIIAAVVLLPEGVAALKAARRNRLQTSVNLALGSALACIGLTVPAVVAVCLVYGIPLVLGLDGKSMVLLGLSVFTVMLSLNQGRTNVLYGVVLLVNLAAYVFTVVVP